MTDTDLARQLVTYVDATTEPVANPSDRRNGQPHPSTPTEMETIMLTEERAEETTTARPARWLMLAAAAVAVIVVGFVITSSGSDDEPAPADQPTPAPAVTSPADETGADDPDVPNPDLAANAAIGDEFVAAMSSYDAAAAAALVSEDASIDPDGGTARDLEAEMAWYAASDFRFESEGCQAFDTGQVSCALTQANMWSDAAGVDPVRARISMTVESGKITHLSDEVDSGIWGGVVFRGFFEYVVDNHPDDVEAMWQLDAARNEQRPTINDVEESILDERGIELFERFSAEYAEAAASSG